MSLRLRSTSTRILVVLPSVVLAEQLTVRRPLRLRWLPVMAWGYAQYRLAGNYRLPRAGGPPGMSQGFPDRLVDTGIYRWTRNPMYLGHLVFAAGLTLTTRSPLAGATTAALVPWFRSRVERDEQRLARRFGQDYLSYTARVPRWLPGTRAVSVKPQEPAASVTNSGQARDAWQAGRDAGPRCHHRASTSASRWSSAIRHFFWQTTSTNAGLPELST